jgi:tetratricopeptide (TPR) repeat protein
MRIQHKGNWIEVNAETVTPWEAQGRQRHPQQTIYSPTLANVGARHQALELLPDLERTATAKKLSRHERLNALKILSTFQSTALLFDAQLETAKKVLNYSKSAWDWIFVGNAFMFAGKVAEACECFERASKLPHKNRNIHTACDLWIGAKRAVRSRGLTLPVPRKTSSHPALQEARI